MSHPGGPPGQQPWQGYPPQPGQPQPGQPQPPAQQQQPGAQQWPPQQPGPQQPGSQQPGPQQWAQPGNPYPQQQWAPQPQPQGAWGQGYPQRPGPLTTAGLGVLPAGLGIVLELVALFAVPWVTFSSGTASVSLTFLDLLHQANTVTMSSGLGKSYVQFFAFLLVALTMASVLPWTLGALRTKRSAFLLSSIRRKELTHANFWWYRTVFAGRATLMLVLHVAGVALIFARNFSLLGLGPYLLVGGALLVVVGAAIGPRRGPEMPR